MNGSLLLSQLLNGLQLGALLFLMSSGLTLIFGIMNFINLAHGSLYMIGAFLGATAYNASGSFAFSILAAVAGSAFVGVVLERLIARPLYRHDHLYQVLATFGLMMFFNELASVIWVSRPYYAAIPQGLEGAVSLFGSDYPVYRHPLEDLKNDEITKKRENVKCPLKDLEYGEKTENHGK